MEKTHTDTTTTATAPKKAKMTEDQRRESNRHHNEALMTLPVETLIAEGYISIMQIPTLMNARKQYHQAVATQRCVDR